MVGQQLSRGHSRTPQITAAFSSPIVLQHESSVAAVGGGGRHEVRVAVVVVVGWGSDWGGSNVSVSALSKR